MVQGKLEEYARLENPVISIVDYAFNEVITKNFLSNSRKVISRHACIADCLQNVVTGYLKHTVLATFTS